VSVVDAYEAMIAGRPYRDAVSHEEAIAELRRQAGVQFDPEIVEVFAALFESGVPWPAEEHHVHPDDAELRLAAGGGPGGLLRRRRSHAEIHDQLHERRRQAV
jgi:hypothetical protein